MTLASNVTRSEMPSAKQVAERENLTSALQAFEETLRTRSWNRLRTPSDSWCARQPLYELQARGVIAQRNGDPND